MNEKGRRIITLRKKGKTYGEIAETLNLPRSTVGWWLRGVKLPKYIEKQILRKSKEKWRNNINEFNKIHSKIRSQEAAKIREDIKKKASKEIRSLSKKDLRLVGSALYWAEGSNHRNSLRFANSDPMMIKIIMKFFREICNISDEKIKARIHLYPQTNQLKATSYWKNVTDLSRNNFQTPQIQISRASKRKRPINTLPYGTLHLTICSTEKACIAKGWVRGIYEKI